MWYFTGFLTSAPVALAIFHNLHTQLYECPSYKMCLIGLFCIDNYLAHIRLFLQRRAANTTSSLRKASAQLFARTKLVHPSSVLMSPEYYYSRSSGPMIPQVLHYMCVSSNTLNAFECIMGSVSLPVLSAHSY